METGIIVAIIGTVLTFIGGIIGAVITFLSQRGKLKSESDKLRAESFLALEELNRSAFERFKNELEWRDGRFELLSRELDDIVKEKNECSKRIDVLEDSLEEERSKRRASESKITALQNQLIQSKLLQNTLEEDVKNQLKMIQHLNDENTLLKQDNVRLKNLVSKNIDTGNLDNV